MSEEYTPTERELQSDWVWAQTQFGPVGTNTYNEAFKRAIAKIKAEAWEECARSIVYEDGTPVEIASITNPYK